MKQVIEEQAGAHTFPSDRKFFLPGLNSFRKINCSVLEIFSSIWMIYPACGFTSADSAPLQAPVSVVLYLK